jgi:hypothetical protein
MTFEQNFSSSISMTAIMMVDATVSVMVRGAVMHKYEEESALFFF